jgi:hypothetical protein
MENRKSGRRKFKFTVEHILGESERCECQSEDVSRGGIQITGTPGHGWGRPRHAWLSIALPDDSGMPIRALGELRYERQRKDGLHLRGYRFKYMSPRERCRFNDFLDRATDG